MKKKLIFIGSALLLIFMTAQFFLRKPASVELSSQDIVSHFEDRIEFLSKTYLIDQKYAPMEGPFSKKEFYLLKDQRKDTVWVTGVDVDIVDEKDSQSLSEDFFCHSAIMYPDENVLSVVQGQKSIHLPDGYGIPLNAERPLTFYAQVKNSLFDDDIKVKSKATLYYQTEGSAQNRLKPLLPRMALSYKTDKKNKLFHHNHSMHEVIDDVKDFVAKDCTDPKELITFAPLDQEACSQPVDHQVHGHWTVKPGREVTRSDVTRYINIPYDTTIHFIGTHIHPFGESIAFRDVTANQTLFTSIPQYSEDKKVVVDLNYYSSQEGIPVYKDHEYEVVSIYNNTSDHDISAMGVMFLYLASKE